MTNTVITAKKASSETIPNFREKLAKLVISLVESILMTRPFNSTCFTVDIGAPQISAF